MKRIKIEYLISLKDLMSDIHHFLNAFFPSLEMDAFPMRAQGLCCGEHRLEFKASYNLKLETETRKKQLTRIGFNQITNTTQG